MLIFEGVAMDGTASGRAFLMGLIIAFKKIKVESIAN